MFSSPEDREGENSAGEPDLSGQRFQDTAETTGSPFGAFRKIVRKRKNRVDEEKGTGS